MSHPFEHRRLTSGNLVVDLDAQEAAVDGRLVPLTRTEFALLRALAEREGCTLSKEALLSEVWGYSFVGDTRVIPVHMGNLRHKLEGAGGAGYLHTLRGMGYKLQAPVSGTAFAPAGRGRGSFVGRTEQLLLLVGLFEQVQAGRGGRAIVVWGEAGIGKTRLMDELATLAADRGALVLWGRSLEEEGVPPYWPWVQVLRAWLRCVDPDVVAHVVGARGSELAILAPELRQHIAGLQPLPPQSTIEARFQFFDAITAVIRAIADQQPLVLMLDDLHDADRASLALLEHVARELGSMRVLIVGGSRDVQIGPDHPLGNVLEVVTREACGDRLPLPAMTPTEVSRLWEAIVGTAPHPDVAEAIWHETEGNPFFVTQIMRLLLEEGTIVGRENFSLATPFRIPEGIRATVHRRLAGLSADCRLVLGVGAVVGRQFSLPLVAYVSGIGFDRAAVALDEAAAGRLIDAVPDHHSFRFRHNVTRRTTYETLGVAQRTRLHGEIGDDLEAVYADRMADHHEELAYHFQQAAPLGWTEKAVRHTVLAGKAATNRYAWEDARRHFEGALALADHLEDRDRRREVAAECQEALGDSLVVTEGYDEARHAYSHAIGAQLPEARVARSRLHRKIGRTYKEQRRLSEAAASFRLAARELGDFALEGSDEEWREWLDGQLELAWVSYYAGDLEEIEQLLAEAEPPLERHGSLSQRLGFLRCHVLHCLLRDGGWATDQGLAYSRAQLDLALKSGVLAEMAFSHALLGVTLHIHAGTDEEFVEAQQHHLVALDLAEQVGDMDRQMLALGNLALNGRLRHDPAFTLHWGQMCIDRPRPGEWLDFVAFGDANLAWAHWYEGNFPRAREHANRALESWTHVQAMPYKWYARMPLLAMALNDGDLEGAAEHARAVFDPFQQTPPPPLAAALQEALDATERGVSAEASAAFERVIQVACEFRWL